jgi:hypothetical protein
MTDYRKYYDLERYLLEEVQPRFCKKQIVSTFDFFCIVIWKANRSKSRISKLMLSKAAANLDEAVAALISELVSAPTNKEKLYVLIQRWKFRLPMASAILAILYPLDFTVYDVRVCEIHKDFKKLKDTTNFEDLWVGYSAYICAVWKSAPIATTLRDKDRYLWGQSFAIQLKRDIKNCFKEESKQPPDE